MMALFRERAAEKAEEARERALPAYVERLVRPPDLDRLMPRAGAMA
jgi:hypothetical protein